MNNRIKWHGHVLRMNKDFKPGEGFEHQSQRKMPKRKAKIKMGTTG
jgi:hypothetical protein